MSKIGIVTGASHHNGVNAFIDRAKADHRPLGQGPYEPAATPTLHHPLAPSFSHLRSRPVAK
jgi:hypothetical protein